jgi:hypothetical protein
MDTQRDSARTQSPGPRQKSDLAGQAKQAVTDTAKETVETAKGAAQEIAGTIQTGPLQGTRAWAPLPPVVRGGRLAPRVVGTHPGPRAR